MKHLENKTPRPLVPYSGAVGDATARLPRIEPLRLLAVLKRRGWLVVPCFLLAVGAMWALLQRMTPVYQAHGSVYVSTGAPGIPEVREIVPVESKELEQLHSVANGMTSSTLLLRVIELSGLSKDPAFLAGHAGEQGWVERFQKRVRVELRRGTRIIDIDVEDHEPARARLLVNTLKEQYERLAAERQNRLMEMIGQGLAAEEQRLRVRMEQSARKLRIFREENPVPGVESGQGAELPGGELAGLRGQLTQLRAERLRLEAEVEGLARLDVTDPDAVGRLPASGETAALSALAHSLRDKQVEFARVKERYLHKHPVYREIAGEISRLEATLTAAMSAAKVSLDKKYQVVLGNEEKLGAEVKRAEGHAVDVDGLRAKFATLARAADADRELYATVERRLRETSLAGSVPGSVLRWEETPLTPEKAAKPNKPVFMALAGGGGLLLGFLLATVLELGDRRLRHPAAVERATGMPLLGCLPASNSRAAGGMVMLSDPGSDIAEAFRGLRAVLAPEWPGTGLRTTLFTSARDGEGKSFCALNHAASLAMQGYRTLLIDADLRQRGLSRNPAASQDAMMPGLGDYLAGNAQPAETCLLTSLPDLYLMASGSPRENASELLADNRFPALLEKASLWFDRVVIDVPAVLGASDVQAVARYADRTCMLVGSGNARRDEVERAAEMLRAAGAKLAGFIWNEVPSGRTEQPFVSPGRRQIASIPGGGEEESLSSMIESAPIPSPSPDAS
ncbi:MAG: hypothetical protein Q8Q59_12200 [Luteolibacter sp.]|jgi:capsular exopolysaccharide synthesis family protein|nr:hypothetical protein [Luteolibacter sp.]